MLLEGDTTNPGLSCPPRIALTRARALRIIDVCQEICVCLGKPTQQLCQADLLTYLHDGFTGGSDARSCGRCLWSGHIHTPKVARTLRARSARFCPTLPRLEAGGDGRA